MSRDEGFNGINTISPDGTGRELVFPADGYIWSATFSPDGTRIAFLSNRKDCGNGGCNGGDNSLDSPPQIWLINTDSTGLRQLTRSNAGGEYQRPFPRTIALLIARLGKQAKIPPTMRCSPHSYRHTFAVMSLRNGANIFSLKQWLGHESLIMVNRYLALSPADSLNKRPDNLSRSSEPAAFATCRITRTILSRNPRLHRLDLIARAITRLHHLAQ